jgi:hypothetical protein
MSRVRTRPILSLLALLAVCACSTGSNRVEYEGGTFYFDGLLDGERQAANRDALNDQFTEDTDALERIVHHQTILAALKTANERNRLLTPADIVRIESAWRGAKESDSAVASHVDAGCGQMLRDFRSRNPSFAEVFVTDRRGFNVCQSNKTTDFYQADEPWWLEASREPGPTHGKLELDASTGAIGVALYVPILEPGTKALIGVAKGLVWRQTPE